MSKELVVLFYPYWLSFHDRKDTKNNYIKWLLEQGATFSDALAKAKAQYNPQELTTRQCKYCGNDNNSDDNDRLCSNCREIFGHSYFYEL